MPHGKRCGHSWKRTRFGCSASSAASSSRGCGAGCSPIRGLASGPVPSTRKRSSGDEGSARSTWSRMLPQTNGFTNPIARRVRERRDRHPRRGRAARRGLRASPPRALQLHRAPTAGVGRHGLRRVVVRPRVRVHEAAALARRARGLPFLAARRLAGLERVGRTWRRQHSPPRPSSARGKASVPARRARSTAPDSLRVPVAGVQRNASPWRRRAAGLRQRARPLQARCLSAARTQCPAARWTLVAPRPSVPAECAQPTEFSSVTVARLEDRRRWPHGRTRRRAFASPPTSASRHGVRFGRATNSEDAKAARCPLESDRAAHLRLPEFVRLLRVSRNGAHSSAGLPTGRWLAVRLARIERREADKTLAPPPRRNSPPPQGPADGHSDTMRARLRSRTARPPPRRRGLWVAEGGGCAGGAQLRRGRPAPPQRRAFAAGRGWCAPAGSASTSGGADAEAALPHLAPQYRHDRRRAGRFAPRTPRVDASHEQAASARQPLRQTEPAQCRSPHRRPRSSARSCPF